MNRVIRPLFGVALLFGVAACSDDSPSKTTTPAASSPAATTPEDKISTDAEVATGLKKMLTEANQVVTAASDKSAGDHAYEEAHETWEDIEGTVKKNEPTLYASIEEDLAALKAAAGDASKATPAVASLTTNVNAYLVKHPG